MNGLTYAELNKKEYVEIRNGIKSISVNKEAVNQVINQHPANYTELIKETGLDEKKVYAATKQLLKEGKISRIMHGGTLFFINKTRGSEE